MYETIKKFLDEGGKCLLIENGKPIGVVLTMGEFNFLRNRLQTTKPVGASAVGEAAVNEINFSADNKNSAGSPGALADFADISLADAGDVTLEDLGLDELPY